MDFGAKTNIGTRKTNQDYFYKSDIIPLFIIADGMGGHNAGEIASKMSTEIIAKYIEEKYNNDLDEDDIKSIILKSIEMANIEVYDKSCSEEKYNGMGTTISLAVLHNKKLFIGHVGDSRVYIIRDGEIDKITEDHSLVAELFKQGSITREEARNHPQKNIITRAVGTDITINADLYEKDLNKNDIIVIATDGLTNIVSEKEIKDNILCEKDLDECSQELVLLAKNMGGQDNITIMAFRI